jgi:hypothetical protein
MDNEVLHFRVKKDYAQQLLALLLKDDAIETVIEEDSFELTQEQKVALDKELILRENGLTKYTNWDDLKYKYL